MKMTVEVHHENGESNMFDAISFVIDRDGTYAEIDLPKKIKLPPDKHLVSHVGIDLEAVE